MSHPPIRPSEVQRARAALKAVRVGLLAATAMVWVGDSTAEGQAAFREASAELGIDFEHLHFGTGQKYMPENMGAGVALFDADQDGRLDVYLVQGAPLDGARADEATNRLFLQGPNGRFTDATEKAGVGDRGFGMGAAFGDIDRDGDLDLYVTNYGRNTLYRNRGDGSFDDVTDEAGVGGNEWSASSGFFDADGDGDLDLYVTQYVDFDLEHHKFCGNAQAAVRSYCHPDVYDGVADVLYRNDGEGRFENVSRQAGLLSTSDDKGLGVLLADLDGDGTQDIYVANDSTRNYFYSGRPGGMFFENALLAGVGFNGSGAAEASMGVDIADLDADGRPEIFLTHLDEETNTLFRNDGQGLWTDRSDSSGLGPPSRPWVGFGAVFLDFDHDGDEDLFVGNGHIIDNIKAFAPTRSHRQPAQLYENLGGLSFSEHSALLGLAGPLVVRGAAAGDLDNDGDLDLVLTQNNGRALVLLNEGSHGNSLRVRLQGETSNPQAFGARVEIRTGERKQARWLKSASSYLSQGSAEVHFGLGQALQADELIVHWPSGKTDRFSSLAAGRLFVIQEGGGAPRSLPFN